MADKYNQGDRDKMAKAGSAMSDGSYPIADAEDLANAIHAVGRGNADHNSIRKHIMARAKALGLSKDIPDNWNADGSITEQNAAKPAMQKCPTCKGSGKINDGSTTCPECDGSGEVEGTGDVVEDGEQNAADPELERRKRLADKLSGRQIEHRMVAGGQVELRSSDDGKLHVTGYASVAERPYDIGGMYQETIKRGAFKKTLAENPTVQLLLNHTGLPLASTRNGTLALQEDGVGLKFDAELDPDDPESQVVVRKVRAGLMDECSFAFQAVRQSWNDDYTQRALTEVSIDKGDVSIVNNAANPATSVSARADEIAESHLLVQVKAQIATRCYELKDVETRAGAALSAANRKQIQDALDFVASADTDVDKAQVILASVLKIQNPDIEQDKDLNYTDPSANGSGDGVADPPARSRSFVMPAPPRAQRARLEALRNGKAAA